MGNEMRSYAGCVVIAGLSLLSACAPPTRRDVYESQREAMIGSPAAYRWHVQQCMRQLRAATPNSMVAHREVIAGVSLKHSDQVVCERFMAGVRDGTIPYEPYVSMVKGQPTPEVVRILNGL